MKCHLFIYFFALIFHDNFFYLLNNYFFLLYSLFVSLWFLLGRDPNSHDMELSIEDIGNFRKIVNMYHYQQLDWHTTGLSYAPTSLLQSWAWNDIVHFCEKLIPFLLEIWAECRAELLACMDDDNVLAMTTLTLQLLVALWRFLLQAEKVGTISQSASFSSFKRPVRSLKPGNNTNPTMRHHAQVYLKANYFSDLSKQFLPVFPWHDTNYGSANCKVRRMDSIYICSFCRYKQKKMF